MEEEEEEESGAAGFVAHEGELRSAGAGGSPEPAGIEGLDGKIGALLCANEALVKGIAAMRAQKEDLAVVVNGLEEDGTGRSLRLELLQAETESLRIRKRSLCTESDELATAVADLALRKSGLVAETESVSAEKSFLENALALSNARIQDFSDELHDLDLSNTAAKELIGNLESKIEQLEDEIRELQKEIETSRNQCNAQESENSELHKQNTTMERQLEDLLEMRAVAEKQASEKKVEIEALQSEVSDSTQISKRLKGEISCACSDISTLGSHRSLLLSGQEELEMQICELRSELQSIQSGYEAACSASDEERKLAKSLFDSLDASHANSRRLEEELIALKTIHSECQAADEKDQAQISKLENEIGSFLKEKASLQEVKRALEEELGALMEPSSKLVNLREKVKRLEAELNKAREEVGNSDLKAQNLVSDLEVSRDFLLRKSALSSFSMPLAAISTVTLVAIAGFTIFKHSKRKH